MLYVTERSELASQAPAPIPPPHPNPGAVHSVRLPTAASNRRARRRPRGSVASFAGPPPQPHPTTTLVEGRFPRPKTIEVHAQAPTALSPAPIPGLSCAAGKRGVWGPQELPPTTVPPRCVHGPPSPPELLCLVMQPIPPSILFLARSHPKSPLPSLSRKASSIAQLQLVCSCPLRVWGPPHLLPPPLPTPSLLIPDCLPNCATSCVISLSGPRLHGPSTLEHCTPARHPGGPGPCSGPRPR